MADQIEIKHEAMVLLKLFLIFYCLNQIDKQLVDQCWKQLVAALIFGNYLDEIGMRFPRTHRILNHCLRRWRVCRHVRMTWGTICITPITTGSWVRWIAASIPICWVVIPGPLARVIAIRWKSMCWVCWNESIERGVNTYITWLNNGVLITVTYYFNLLLSH